MEESKRIIDERIKQINTQIGINVAKERVAAGVSAEWLSKKIGITKQQISKYESGENAVPPGRLVLIAEALEVDLLSLFNNTFNSSNTQKANIRKISCIKASRNFTEIQDPYEQRTIYKIIKETVDNQK